MGPNIAFKLQISSSKVTYNVTCISNYVETFLTSYLNCSLKYASELFYVQELPSKKLSEL